MKVALICHSFPHYRGGVLRQLLNSREHDYLFVADQSPSDPTIRGWKIEQPERFRSAPCRALFGPLYFQRGLTKLALRKDLAALIYLGNPYYLSTWISALAARLTGKRILFWTHGWTQKERGPKAWIRQAFYKLSHGLLLYGHFAKVIGIAKGVAAEKLHVIYNSLDYDRQKEIRQRVFPRANQLKSTGELAAVKRDLFDEPGLPMVICSARLTRACRFDLLLQAQADLRDQGHHLNVLLVGDGPERASLQQQATALETPVRFFGECYDEETLARLTMAARVTVSPGKVGLTAMHSLAYGVPVITHDDFESQMPEAEAILPGRTGEFFRRGDVTDLARVLKAWTATKFPDTKCRAECYKVLERFYNPSFQRRAIERALRGEPADDLFWMREPL